MKKLTALLLLLPILASAEATSQIGPELTYLARTPVSRLEYALYRWNEDIDSWMEFQQISGASWAVAADVSLFLMDTGRLSLRGILFSRSAAETECAKFFTAVRERFADERLYGHPLDSYFGASPFDPKPPVENMARSVGRLIDISCYVHGYETKVPMFEGDDDDN